MSLCISVSSSTTNECINCLNQIVKARDTLKGKSIDNTGLIAEFRIDLMSNQGSGELTGHDLINIFEKANSLQIGFIVTCRELSKGETGFSEQRKEKLKQGIKNGASFVDLEIEASTPYISDVINFVKTDGSDCNVIVSYHNYETTPPTDELRSIIDKCFNLGADVAKIATAVKSLEENARLVSLYEYAFQKFGKKVIILGMGEVGKITRVSALKLGSLLTFVSESEETATAPGQLTLAQMTNLLELGI